MGWTRLLIAAADRSKRLLRDRGSKLLLNESPAAALQAVRLTRDFNKLRLIPRAPNRTAKSLAWF
jgi:hypothetical protein